MGLNSPALTQRKMCISASSIPSPPNLSTVCSQLTGTLLDWLLQKSSVLTPTHCTFNLNQTQAMLSQITNGTSPWLALNYEDIHPGKVPQTRLASMSGSSAVTQLPMAQHLHVVTAAAQLLVTPSLPPPCTTSLRSPQKLRALALGNVTHTVCNQHLAEGTECHSPPITPLCSLSLLPTALPGSFFKQFGFFFSPTLNPAHFPGYWSLIQKLQHQRFLRNSRSLLHTKAFCLKM